MTSAVERFLDYIKYDTESDENSSTFPSTKKQLIFAERLKTECINAGLSEVSLDDNGYVTATLKGNIPFGKTIGFISHMDTSNEACGKGITPVITKNYDGGEINLKGISLSPAEFPFLKKYIGDTIISSDGTTLLGADDKAGIAEILTAMQYLSVHSEIPHGDIKIAFTPDEEIGKGVDRFDVEGFGADFAYTVDGGAEGELEFENFNAARAKISIKGKSVHPGSAKNIMVNASLIACELVNLLPKNEAPAHTENYEGFYHVVLISGSTGSAEVSIIIRDHNFEKFEARKAFISDIISRLNDKYNNALTLNLYDEYYNMSEKIKQDMRIVELAKTSMLECGVTPVIQPIRGGTDGARLSFMSLPCPNIFTGGYNFHGPYECIPVSSMEKAVSTIINICKNANKIF